MFPLCIYLYYSSGEQGEQDLPAFPGTKPSDQKLHISDIQYFLFSVGIHMCLCESER